MKKSLITAAVGALASPFMALLVAFPANAAPCQGPDDKSLPCTNCIVATGGGIASVQQCDGINVGAPPQVHYPDCDQYKLPTNYSICVDQHAAGQR